MLLMTDSPTQEGGLAFFSNMLYIFLCLHISLPVVHVVQSCPMYSGQCLCGIHLSGRGFLKIVNSQGCLLGRHCLQTRVPPTKTTCKNKEIYQEQCVGVLQNKLKLKYDFKRQRFLSPVLERAASANRVWMI